MDQIAKLKHENEQLHKIIQEQNNFIWLLIEHAGGSVELPFNLMEESPPENIRITKETDELRRITKLSFEYKDESQ